jgi:hypothetical protein
MPPPQKLPPMAQAAYAELKRSLQASARLDLRGAPTRVQRGGRVYWYDSFRVGAEVRKTYLGEDSDELRARLLHARALAQAELDRKADRARLVRVLRAEGLLGVTAGAGGLLAALAGAGAFERGLNLIGAAAFRLYEGELGVRLNPEEAPAERLMLAIPADPSQALREALKGFAFDPVPALRKERTWRWRQSRGETLVGFATDAPSEADPPRYVDELGVYAQPFRGLGWLTGDAINVAAPYRSGVLVAVPRPERFAVRAWSGGDSLSDARQAAALAAAVEPETLRLARLSAPAALSTGQTLSR